MTRPRVRDIALAAGVSPATVSNVLNNKKGVGAEAAQNVLRVAREMGYAAPGGEKYARIRFVMCKKHGLVVMDTPFFAQLVEGLEAVCRENGFELMILSIDLADCDARARAVAGDAETPFILLATEADEADIDRFRGARAPMLALDRQCEGLPSVTLDNFGAGYQAAKILKRYGHRRIGYLASAAPFQNDARRKLGLVAGLYEDGLALDPADVIALCPTMEGARRDMLAHLETREAPLPTAFFALNDIVAIGASRALKERGYRLPEDVSMIGMDDIPAARVVSPALTTMHVDISGFGRAAMAELLRAIEHKLPDAERPLSLVAPVSPVERESVAPPREGGSPC